VVVVDGPRYVLLFCALVRVFIHDPRNPCNTRHVCSRTSNPRKRLHKPLHQSRYLRWSSSPSSPASTDRAGSSGAGCLSTKHYYLLEY